MLGSIGPTELVVILAVVVILFGARRLPQLGRSIGEGIREFRNVGKSILDDDDGGHDG